MPVYLDLFGGNDANDGLSFANRVKTFNRARAVGAADEIRVMETPTFSVGSFSWTNNSQTVGIPSGLVETVTECETNWTAATNVTSALITTALGKVGTNSVQLTVAAGFTTGKAAHFTLPAALDLSSFQGISFLMRSSGVTLVANNMKIRLCSDTAGDTVVDEFNVLPFNNAGAGTSQLFSRVLLKTGGGNLGSNINSISVSFDVDPGAVVIVLDNIMAATFTGNFAQLAHDSVLVPDDAYDIPYFVLGFASSTSLLLGVNLTTILKFHGTTGSYSTTAYSAISVFDFPVSAGTTAVTLTPGSAQTILALSGFAKTLLSGGWSATDMATQTGKTYFDGLTGNTTISMLDHNTSGGLGVEIDSLILRRVRAFRAWGRATAKMSNSWMLSNQSSFMALSGNERSIEYLNSVVCLPSTNLAETNIVVKMDNFTLISPPSGGMRLRLGHNTLTDGVRVFCDTAVTTSPLSTGSGVGRHVCKNIIIYPMGASGVGLNITSDLGGPVVVENFDCGACTVGISVGLTGVDGNILFKNCTFPASTGSYFNSAGDYVEYAYLNSGSTSQPPTRSCAMAFDNINSANDKFVFTSCLAISSDSTTYRTAAPSIRIRNYDANSSTTSFDEEVYFHPLLNIAVKAGKEVTVNFYTKCHSTTTPHRLRLSVFAIEAGGGAADVHADQDISTTDWVADSLVWTPVVDGVVPVFISSLLGNTASGSGSWIDDITVTMAD